MDVAAHGVALAANHQQHLRVSLETRHAVAHVRTDIFEALCPAHVVLLIEPRLQFDQHGHLLPPFRRLGQQPRDTRIATRPVERQLDGDHVGVVHGGLDEPLDRAAEALVRMVQEQVPLANYLEDVAAAGESDRSDGMMGGVLQRRQVDRARQSDHIRGIQQARYFVNVGLSERSGECRLGGVEFRDQDLTDRAGETRGHLQAHHRPEATVPHFLLNRAQEVLGFVVIHFEVGISGDTKGVATEDLHAGEEGLDVCGDQLLKRDVAPAPRRHGHPARQDLRHLDPGEALLAVTPAQGDREREAQVRDVREWMSRIDRQGREHGEDIVAEVAVELLPLLRIERGNIQQFDPGRGECRGAPPRGGSARGFAPVPAPLQRRGPTVPPGSAPPPSVRCSRPPTGPSGPPPGSGRTRRGSS